ncbi:MAG: hypothetical protein J6V91_01025, partial [Kiritimatiellae bacterium]|nr:hypothetical protein [Kiritimatiellia bacterium]
HQVRDHLEDLRGMDPDAVIAQKTHLGGTAGINYDELLTRAQTLADTAEAARQKVADAIKTLFAPAEA